MQLALQHQVLLLSWAEVRARMSLLKVRMGPLLDQTFADCWGLPATLLASL